MRLIDADEFRKTMLAEIELLYRVGHPYSATVVSDVIKKLDLEPSVDAEPVVHAHWHLFDSDLGYKIFRCSKCSYERVIEDEEIPDYCEKCGAKMDEELE